MSAKYRGDRIDSLPDPLFQQGEENLFLASKIGVEGAARIAGPGSDVFQASGFETVTCKDSLGGGQEFSPGRFGPLGLPGAHARPGGYADQAIACVLGRR